MGKRYADFKPFIFKPSRHHERMSIHARIEARKDQWLDWFMMQCMQQAFRKHQRQMVENVSTHNAMMRQLQAHA